MPFVEEILVIPRGSQTRTGHGVEFQGNARPPSETRHWLSMKVGFSGIWSKCDRHK